MDAGAVVPQIDPQTGERIPSGGVKIDPQTGERLAATPATAPQSPGILKTLQDTYDQAATTDPANARPGVGGALKTAGLNLGTGMLRLASPVVHPEAAAASVNPPMASTAMIGNKPVPVPDMGMASSIANTAQSIYQHPKESLMKGLGELEALPGTLIGAKGISEAPAIGRDIRSAAIGDPNEAALKGLRIGSASPKAQSTISAVEGARPFFQGVKSQAELQSRIAPVKDEIWTPYNAAVQKAGPEAQGLENRRLEISAQLRTLKAGGPEAIALAQQKGLTQAGLIAEEKAIHGQLDPMLQKAGVDPQLIRKTFGQVAQVGGRVAGKSTLAEAKQPFGLSRLSDVSLTKPLSNIPLVGGIARDLAAGRYFSASPTDVAIREAFRPGGEKPNFQPGFVPAPPVRSFRTPNPAVEPTPLRLEANVPANEYNGPDYSHGGPIGMNAPRSIAPEPPQQFPQLTARASEGEAQPMIRYARPYVEPPESSTIRPMPPQGFPRLAATSSGGGPEPMIWAKSGIAHPGAAENFGRTRIQPNEFNLPEVIPPVARIGTQPSVQFPRPEILTAPRGLLKSGTPEILPPSDIPIHPPGSASRNYDENLYPKGSKYGKKPNEKK